MAKRNILIYDDKGLFYGSLEKLFQLFAKVLAPEFNVFFAYGTKHGELLKDNLVNSGVTLLPFEFEYRKSREPYTVVGMKPGVMEIIQEHKIDCVFTAVFAHYQFPLNIIPATMPVVLVSPFGHYCSNGGVTKTYVSGQSNLLRLQSRGVKTAELLFNPLEDFPAQYLKKAEIGKTIIFGRIGRGEDSIFDPISLRAFKLLENKYGERVKYIVVNPPPAWKKMSEELNVKNQEFRPPITKSEDLAKFYQEIDVCAHSRLDGETVGMAIAEAMLAGNPILTHKSNVHNDHLDILDSAYAMWCEKDDVEQYFKNMEQVVLHPEKIRQMGQLARKRALEVFSLDFQRKNIIETFNQACDHCTFYQRNGKLKGYFWLCLENLKAMPFYLGRLLTYVFPGLEWFGRRIYYRLSGQKKPLI